MTTSRRHTVGFDELKARAAEFPVERVAMITGLAPADILQLSREYAKAKASAIRQGVAIERSPGGGDSVRAVTCLPALTGAWRQPGGGTVEMPIYEFPMSLAHVCRPDWIKPGTRVVNELDLGSALTGRMKLDPPIKSVFFYNSNPVSQAPDAGELVRGLKRDDLFTVASELFLTDTAKYADIILPACMEGEQYDIMVTWGHLYIQLNMPAIKPPGECMANIDMFRRLAKTMGYTDDYWHMDDDEWLTKAYDWDAPQLQGITLDLLKKDGWKRLNVGSPAESASRTPRATSRRRRASASSPPAWRRAATWCSRFGARATPACRSAASSIPCRTTFRRTTSRSTRVRTPTASRLRCCRPSRTRSSTRNTATRRCSSTPRASSAS